MRLHEKIQHKLKEKYEREGYKVELEATIPISYGKFHRADLLCKKGDKKIVVEVGRTQQHKINNYKALGYEVRIVSFHYVKNGIIYCICGHEWKPRKKYSLACPRCKQYLFWEEGKRYDWNETKKDNTNKGNPSSS